MAECQKCENSFYLNTIRKFNYYKNESFYEKFMNYYSITVMFNFNLAKKKHLERKLTFSKQLFVDCSV